MKHEEDLPAYNEGLDRPVYEEQDPLEPLKAQAKQVAKFLNRWKWMIGLGVFFVVTLAVFFWPTEQGDPTRSRLEAGTAVVIHSDDGQAVEAFIDTDNSVILKAGTPASVVSDTIPDASAEGEMLEGVGFGPMRPIRVRVGEGELDATTVTVLRHNLRASE